MLNVVVTGGSRGLGLAIVSALASSGYLAIAVARSETEELRSAAEGIAREGKGKLEFRRFDLTDIRAIPSFVRGLRKEFGSIYGLVNNAGLGTPGVLALMRDDDVEKLVKINTIAPLILTKYVVRAMMSERAGRVVNISSIVGSTGYSGLSVYAATKASLLGFTRSLAREVGQLGITVNAVSPGFVDTRMTQELDAEERARIARRSALKRLVGPDDVAAAVRFLLSDDAKNITGTTLTVDAGNTT